MKTTCRLSFYDLTIIIAFCGKETNMTHRYTYSTVQYWAGIYEMQDVSSSPSKTCVHVCVCVYRRGVLMAYILPGFVPPPHPPPPPSDPLTPPARSGRGETSFLMPRTMTDFPGCKPRGLMYVYVCLYLRTVVNLHQQYT
jgi:hypothetical protein